MIDHMKAQELERRLAEAKGLNVVATGRDGTIWIEKEDGGRDWISAQPAHNVADCMALMVQLDLWPRRVRDSIVVRDEDEGMLHLEPIDLSPDLPRAQAVKMATMYAVVAAAIVLLNRTKTTMKGTEP